MKPQDCPSFPGCSAPLCPLDTQSIAHGMWFADEAICCAHGRRERWLAMQRRIAKKTTDRKRGYFTVAMLDVLAAVGRAIKGIDPEASDAGDAEARWITRHRKAERVARPATEAQIRARAAFADARKRSKCSGEIASPAVHDPEAIADAGRTQCLADGASATLAGGAA